MEINWYTIAIIFGLAVIGFFATMYFFAKYMVSKDKIHRCGTCGQFMEKSQVEKHLQENHMDGAI